MNHHIYSILEDREFADDIDLIPSNSGHLQRKTEDIFNYTKQVGLYINKNKTKTMQLVQSHAVMTVNHEP